MRSVGARGLYVQGELEGVKVSLLVDTGADLTVVRTGFFEQLSAKKTLELKDVSLDMAVADGRPLAFSGCGRLQLKVGSFAVEHEIWVADIDVDALLGYDFLQRYNCTIDAGKGELTIRGIQHDNIEKNFDGCRVVIAKTVVIPQESEKMVAARIPGMAGVEVPAVVECNERFTERHGVMVAKILVDPSNELVPLRLMNPSNRPITLYEGTLVGECYSAEVIENNPSVGCRTLQGRNRGDGVPPTGPTQLTEPLEELALRSCTELTEAQAGEVRKCLAANADVFARSKEDLGRTDLVQHQINTGTARPIRQAPRRLPIHRKGEARIEVERMLDHDIIEPSMSAWASPIVLVKKKDGSTRFCVDYRKLNDVTEKDSYPLPRIDDTLDTLSGAKWFSTLDLASGYWQVEVQERDRPKTAFVTGSGLFQFKVLPFGLCNAPATFERLMERVLKGLQWQTCLLYLDDVIVYGDSFEKTLKRLAGVFQRLREAKLKLNPKKCNLFRREVNYLGHVVSSEGIAPDPEKVRCVLEWPTPCSTTEVRSFVGLCSYYRRFVKGFSHICAPLFRLTEKERDFRWNEDCELAFRKMKQELTSAPILVYPDEKRAFILDSDASNFAIGSVLSQVTEGSTQEKVVAYFSKALSKTERNYCVTRKELLAIVLSIKHFHHYLYGAKFVVRTDHGALRWLVNFRNPEGQLARWLETLSTYDFDITHRPGRIHGNADALSRRPCNECRHCEKSEEKEDQADKANLAEPTVKQVFVINRRNESEPAVGIVENHQDISQSQPYSWFHRWTHAELRKMQIDDSDIGPILLWKEVQDSRPNWEQITAGSPALKNYWSQWDRLLLKGGVLYRKFETDAGDSELHQLVVPKEIQEEILDKSHNHRLSGHFMTKKTLKRIRELYYWSGYRGHVEKWCKSCDACASRKGPRKKANASLKQYGAGHVLQRCAMDIMGPLPVSSRGNRYVVVIADYFTKWTEAFAIADMEAETVARVLVEEFICRFGVPEELHTDQGRQFESELFQHMCRLLDIHKTRTTPFHPQSDGMVERFNRTLEDMLSLVVSENQKDWDAWLPYLLMAYRSAEHESTGFSPAEIMLGRMVTLPLSAQLPRLPDETDSPRKPTPKYVLELDKTMHRIHEIARGKLKLASDKQKKFHDKGAYNQEFTQGDLIWLLNTKRKRGISPKLQKRWDGPGKILKKLSDVIYRVKMRPKKKPQVVHHNRLKPYIGEDPPLWLLRKPSISEAPQQTVTEVENLQKQ